MAVYSYSSLRKNYKNFHRPFAVIKVNGKTVGGKKSSLAVSNINVDLTCGFEASQASFDIINCYDSVKSTFEFGSIKKFVSLGAGVEVYTGYSNVVREVFRGIVCRVDFVIDEGVTPHVTVTAMDIKAVMMANHYHKQLSAKSYSGAVKEIFNQSLYMNLQQNQVIKKFDVAATPDASPAEAAGGSAPPDTGVESDKTIEMVGESDYEFVVRAAKRFNYEFFVNAGTVMFRSARCDSVELFDIDNTTEMKSLNVSYDITGLVGNVEVRGLDVGKGKIIKQTYKNGNKLSEGSKAKSVVSNSRYVYVDPTIKDSTDAEGRASFLLNDMAYRFGRLEIVMGGLPEMIPGRFIHLSNFGTAVSNSFYVTEVQHRMRDDGDYEMKVIGQANGLEATLPGMDNLSL